MRYFSFFRKTVVTLAGLAIFSLSAFADFTPQTPAFPHGDGITRTGSTEAGLSFPSFNNFTDSTYNGEFVEGVTDERRFAVVQNLGSSGTDTSAPYANSISANIGDYVYVRSYIHNNGYINDATTTANNVTLGFSGFTGVGNDLYYSPSGTSVTLNQFTRASNSTPSEVTDDVIITSANGQPIKLRYYAVAGAVQTAASISGTLHNIDVVDFISGGANIGDVKGCSEESFYTWTIFKVEDGAIPEYNLTLEKTVGMGSGTTGMENATNKSLTVSPGDIVTYKLRYTNELSSTATPVGTKIYDDYDETKLEIMWLPDDPKVCTHDGSVITCDAYDLAPISGQNEHIFYYVARVKADATGTIPNVAEIKPDTDDDTNQADDVSSAVLNVTELPVNGVCGDGATTYASTVDAYPSGTSFCAEGIAVPSSPAFPASGQTVTWTCEGSNGGTDAQCSATKLQPQTYDLTIDKYVGANTAEADQKKKEITSSLGSTITYRIDYTNLSASTATPVGTKTYDNYDEVKLTIINLPTGCSDNGSIITCSVDDLAPGQTRTYYYTATIKSGATSPIDNVIEIKPDTDDDTNSSNDTSSARVLLPNPVNGVCGDGATTYASTVDAYPSGTIFCAEGTAVPSSPAFPAAGQTVTWTCEGSNGGADTQCSATRSTEAPLDITIDKSVTPTETKAGELVTYTLKYQNLTSGTIAKDVIIKDFIPGEYIELDTIQFNTPNGVSCIITQDPDPLVAIIEGRFIQCTIGDLANSSGQQTITYSAKVKSTVAIGTNIDNVAKISTSSPETNISNNNDNARVQVIEGTNQYDLTIDKTVDGVKSKQVSAGQTLTYKLKYKNVTPNTTAYDVTVDDVFNSDYIDMQSLTFTHVPNGMTCQVTSDGDPIIFIFNGYYIHCTGGNLSYDDGEQYIEYTVKVKDIAPNAEVITNLTEIRPNPDDDTNPNNDKSSASVTVNAQPQNYDLSIEKKVDGLKEKSVQKGSTVTFTLDYKNLDSSTKTATDVKIIDTYDSTKLEIVSVPNGCTNANGTLTCSIGNLAVGQSGSITFQAKLLSAFSSGETINNSEIKPNPDEDTNPNNDTSSAKVKIATATPINGQCGNAGKAYPTSTTAYPAGTIFCTSGTVTPASPAFPAINQTVTWQCVGSNGGTTTSCSATRPQSVVHTSTPTPTTTTTTSGGGNTSGSGGGCSKYSVIDLNIAKYVKLGNGSFVSAGSREAAMQLAKNNSNLVTYKIVVSNAGDVATYNVKIKDIFSSSDGLQQSNIKTLSGATYNNGLFEFVNAIPANGSREFIYSATVSAGKSGIGTNTARIESMEQSYKCPKISSAKGVGRTSVAYLKAGKVANAGYILDKTVDKQVVEAGDEINYTLSIKNTGNVDMKNVILIDKFPSEFLEPTEHFKKRLKGNRTLEFKRKFLPVGDTFKVQVKMIVREGVPKGTEITNVLTGRSDTVNINDRAETRIITKGGNATPTCPAGYVWKASLNTCKRKWIPRNIQTGLDLPLIPLGITLMGLALIWRREDFAKLLG